MSRALAIILVALSACAPISPEEARLTLADICANAPETRELIRAKLMTQPGMVELACASALLVK
jgi:hypothetical protein